MDGKVFSAFFIFVLFTCFECRRTPFSALFPEKTPRMRQSDVDPGAPLYLTPYIKAGQIEKARSLSKVGPLNGTSIVSYTGFLTVDEKYNSNMYFWFFPSQGNPKIDPVLLWLQGGPGGTSLFGLFCENGPFQVNKMIQLEPRKVNWNSKHSLLYIDNPVGTGFSFTDDDAGYARNEEDVADDLYSALTQFFQLFYEYAKLDFYITGESYAGKYIPAIAYAIDQKNPGAKTFINLKGVAIGDGLCDPVTMAGYGDLLFQIGMVSELQRDHFKQQEAKAVDLINEQNFLAAFHVFDTLLNGDLTPFPSYFYNVTGSKNYFNYLMTGEPEDTNYFYKFLSNTEVRKSIHVGSLVFNNGTIVEQHLLNDVMQSVKPWVQHILNRKYKVLIYNGQLDIIVGAPLTEKFVWSLEWHHTADYRQAHRTYWRVNPDDVEIAGYVRKAENLYQVVVRGGGHMLPMDQPERTLDMIDRFVTNKEF